MIEEIDILTTPLKINTYGAMNALELVFQTAGAITSPPSLIGLR